MSACVSHVVLLIEGTMLSQLLDQGSACSQAGDRAWSEECYCYRPGARLHSPRWTAGGFASAPASLAAGCGTAAANSRRPHRPHPPDLMQGHNTMLPSDSSMTRICMCMPQLKGRHTQNLVVSSKCRCHSMAMGCPAPSRVGLAAREVGRSVIAAAASAAPSSSSASRIGLSAGARTRSLQTHSVFYFLHMRASQQLLVGPTAADMA